MKYIYVIFLLVSMGSYGQTAGTKESLIIVIIRHGEKYDSGGNLNCKGLNRALHIPAVINQKFSAIKRIFVPTIKNGPAISEDRMFQTATPLAVQDSIKINSQFDVTDTKGLAEYLKTKKGIQLVVWEHSNIPKLGHHLGLGKDSLSWSGKDFDSIWIITFPNGLKHTPKLTRSAEGLNGLPDKCSLGMLIKKTSAKTWQI